MSISLWIKAAAISAISLHALSLMAHHSVDGTYDENRELEISGVITNIRWRNPHVGFNLSVTNTQGQLEDWSVETSSLSSLRRRGVTPDFMRVGDHIQVYGIAARRDPTGIHALSLLLPDASEFILEDGGEPHWADVSRATEGNPNLGRPGDASSPELGIFRVWSLPTELGGGSLWNSSYPLTPLARKSVEAFDLLNDNIARNCAAKGMPTMMEQPYPIAFEKQGNNIVLRVEEYDALRVIDMENTTPPLTATPSPTGYSVGRWEGKTLVVTTTQIDWPHFDGRGIPLSPEAQIIERWTPSDDGSQLHYSLTTIDPQTFTQPVELKRTRLWYPDAVISPYQCDD